MAKKFLPDRYVEGTCPVCGQPDARGDQCEKCGSYLNPLELKNPRSKLSGGTPEVRETSHWYFPAGRISRPASRSTSARRRRQEEWKENVLNYCRGWFKDGLKDRAVTRDLDWGVRVPVPGYEQKVVYVWFDAVLGYITSTREWAERQGTPDAWKKYWLSPDDEVRRLHREGQCRLPLHRVPGHAYGVERCPRRDSTSSRTMFLRTSSSTLKDRSSRRAAGGGSMSMSSCRQFPADPLRYYLTMNLPEYRDSDFTWKEFQAKNNNELADIFGNFINRTLAFAVRTFKGTVPHGVQLQDRDREMLDLARRTPAAAGAFMEGYHFRDGTHGSDEPVPCGQQVFQRQRTVEDRQERSCALCDDDQCLHAGGPDPRGPDCRRSFLRPRNGSGRC